MSDDVGEIWWDQCCWVDAVLDADEGNPGPLVARLRSPAPLTQWHREFLAQLLERRPFRPGPEITEADIKLDSAASEVRKLRAIQKKGTAAAKQFQKLASLNGGTLSIFQNAKLNPLVSIAHAPSWSGDDAVMLHAGPYIQRNLHKMSKDQLVEQVAKHRGVPEEALHDYLGCRGRAYRRVRDCS